MNGSGSEYQYGLKNAKKRIGVKRDKKLVGIMRIVLTAVLAMTTAAMLVLSLFARVELTEINDANVELKQKLRELREDERRLCIEYEFSQDLGELDDYARSSLGMQSTNQRRADIIDTSPEDRAYITDNG